MSDGAMSTVAYSNADPYVVNAIPSKPMVREQDWKSGWGKTIKSFFESSDNVAESANGDGTAKSRSRRAPSTERSNTYSTAAIREGKTYWTIIKDSVSTMSSTLKMRSQSLGRTRDDTVLGIPKPLSETEDDQPPFKVASIGRDRGVHTMFGPRSSPFRSRSVPPRSDEPDEQLFEVVCDYADIPPAGKRQEEKPSRPDAERFASNPWIQRTPNTSSINLANLSAAAVPLPTNASIAISPSQLRTPGRPRFSFESETVESLFDGGFMDHQSRQSRDQGFRDYRDEMGYLGTNDYTKHYIGRNHRASVMSGKVGTVRSVATTPRMSLDRSRRPSFEYSTYPGKIRTSRVLDPDAVEAAVRTDEAGTLPAAKEPGQPGVIGRFAIPFIGWQPKLTQKVDSDSSDLGSDEAARPNQTTPSSWWTLPYR
ncbi:hypothetical protein HDU97_004498 [Phlyctochytrium planicorne]|nr:hypothetical protein HDU97_004498 [Phlyctochytrium planicorne]